MDKEELSAKVDKIWIENQYSPPRATLMLLEVIAEILIEMGDELKQRRNNNG